MTTETDDIEVIVDGAAEIAPPLVETKTDDTAAALEQLKAQLSEEKAARAAAEARANDATGRIATSEKEVQDTNLQLLVNAIDTVKGNTAHLKRAYAEAAAAGDWDAAAEAQSEMANNAAKLLQLENGKIALEQEAKAPRREQPAADPVESLARQLTPRSASWVRAHPEFARDPRQYQRMLAAHNLVVGDGIEPDSDDYFDAIEQTLKIKPITKVEVDDDATAGAAKVVQERGAPPAAPVTRSGNGSGGRNTVRLTAEQVEMASNMGMTAAEYAKNLQDLKASGRIH